jgi:hypothetical protein
VSRLEAENRELKRALEGIGRTELSGVAQRVQSLEGRLGTLEQRLSIAERR